ncbi:trafficking protein particle complex subunit 11 [Contarinia nasturtii]|uniref:trafficking protein particle complex subunit 11 n=1 Tax=Contarinia nasturtii TaxID=265458 RepID=UPI0012D3E408|nr:trafficking protein particle complex subunit 11 [Contarinia nasturtii]
MQQLPVTVPSDANMLPPELMETPQPVIGFVGLDCSRNLVHKSIWDAFNTNRKLDRAAIQFKLLPTNYEFPVVKPKRQYEWYHPKGIIKRNWILKHLHVLPAVIALFQDMEWNDPDWTDKQFQCLSLVQSIKNSMQTRHTKIVIVLLQKSTNADDVSSSDRLSTLAAKCDINQKMIFVLPYNDNLMGYTLRLESAFLDHAQSYYLQSSKQVRAHRDQISSHYGLKIRHQFKLGFYCEMRLDLNSALKHFSQAYEWLEEIRIVDSNCLEIKVVAGFLNYKITKLMFNIGSPRDAITQFRTHIDKYRNRVGYKDLTFEHFAWMSVQYSAFADLFCDAIKCGLPAIQTQHPGIYYHKSAEYMSKRKESFQQICQAQSPLIDFLPLSEQNALNYSNILYSDFFGVRGGNRTELVNEQQIIAIVQECEKYFGHSIAHITLLSQSMAQYKCYKCPRFRKKLAIEMAEEYLKMGDASKALTLYSLMLSEYRTEKWNTIFTQVLLKTLRSALLSTSIPDFIACSIESLSKHIYLKHSDRIVILENLWKVFQKVPPLIQGQIVPEIHINWEKALETFHIKTLSFDLDKITELFDCTVKFEKNQIHHDDIARVNLFIRSMSDVPIKVHEFVIIISDTKSAQKIVAHQWTEINNIETENLELNKNCDLIIQPEKQYKIGFSGERYQFMENSELRVIRLEIKIGTPDNFVTLLQSLPSQHKSDFKMYNRTNEKLNISNESETCYIIPLFHLKTESLLSHDTMLTNEWFAVTIRIENVFDMLVENVSLVITVPVNIQNKVFIASDLTASRQKLLSRFELNIGDMAPKSLKIININVISLIEGTLELQKTVRYQITNDRSGFPKKAFDENPIPFEKSIQTTFKSMPSVTLDYIEDAIMKSKKDTISIPCEAEFVFIGQFFTLNKEPLRKAVKNEEFLFQIELEIKNQHIDILDMFLISDFNVTEKPYVKSHRKIDKSYSRGEKVYDVLLLRAEQTTLEWVYQPFVKSPQKNNVFTKVSSFVENHKPFANTQNNENLENDSNKVIEHILEPKTMYNHTIDAFNMVENRKGFLNAHTLHSSTSVNVKNQIIGVYCIRWRRTGEVNENETKLIVNCIEIVEAPLNIYCYLDEKMYVKVPMTLLITLKNTSNSTLHLKSFLKNADNFMFAGHSQFNVSLFAQSTFNLEFNLYPLKAGWQNLPEFIITFNTNEEIRDQQNNNFELQNLVERWIPKKVFILPMVKQA